MKKLKDSNLAILINSPDLFFLNSIEQQRLFIVVEKQSLLEILARKNFKKDKIITYAYRRPYKLEESVSLATDNLLTKTDFTQQLLNKGIKYFFVPYRSSKKIEKWSKATGIKLIVTPLAFQNKLENKKYFDNFLKKHQIASPPRIAGNKIKKKQSYVIQEAKVSNFLRTNFFPNGNKLASYIRKKNICLKKYVIREYLPGVSVGVSLFIDTEGNYFFSALRRQCFIYQNNFPQKFLGIQWLKTDFFPVAVTKKINQQLKKLSQDLIRNKFFGVANVDLIIYNNYPYILECNPRLSMSMPQAFSLASLTTYKKSWQFFLNIFSQNHQSKIKIAHLPFNNYTGAVLDLENKNKIIIRNPLSNGVYRLLKGKISFVSNSIKDFKWQKDIFFLFHELAEGQILGRGHSLCTIFSNFPLFNSATGTLNDQGKKLYNYFSQALVN